MEVHALLSALHVAEKLKDATRHCYTSGGRRESVADHSWRMSLMAYWVSDEFPGIDRDKLLRMCLIHDLGECFTGDIPTFLKTQANEDTEETLLYGWVDTLPEPYKSEMRTLYEEMAARETLEARVYKAMDNLEAVIEHNESDIKTWSENEFELNLTYGADKCAFSDYLTKLRQIIRAETEEKIRAQGAESGSSVDIS